MIGKKEITFCVADPDFEENQTIYTKQLKYDEAHTKASNKKALSFWSKNIFPKLLQSVQIFEYIAQRFDCLLKL